MSTKIQKNTNFMSFLRPTDSHVLLTRLSPNTIREKRLDDEDEYDEDKSVYELTKDWSRETS